MNLNGSDEEEGGDFALKINKDYADRYNNWRSKEEYQKLKDRYGDVSLKENEGESSSESEDDNAELLTPSVERSWLKTLAAIKCNDPSLYDDSRSFFNEETVERDKRVASKKSKKVTLLDMERKIITERDGKMDSDGSSSSEDKPIGYYEEQDQIRSSLLSAAADSESDDDLLKTKVKSKQQQIAEEEEYLKFLEGQEAELANEDQEQLSGLRDYWNRSDMTADEKFLKNFILQKKYKMHEDSHSEHSDSDDECPPFQFQELSDESDIERAENFEKKFNFRFEEPDKDFIKAYPRTLERTMRVEKNKSRKDKRAAKRENKQEDSDRKFEDLSRLRQFKRQQLAAKLTSIKEKSGAKLMPFTEEELDEDFNPDEHDRKMKEMFPEDDEEVTKPEFKYDPLIDGDDELDMEDWDSYIPSSCNIENISSRNKHTSDVDDVIYDGNGDIITDANFAVAGPSYADDDEILDGRQPRRNRRKKSRLRKALEKKKPLFNPQEKTFDEYLEEYYNLQCEDLIGDMKCRFPYRDVTANDFGLSVEEILTAPDTELNKWSSLKKAVQYRSDLEEKKDILKFKRKRKDMDKKQRLIPSLFREDEEDGVEESESENQTTEISTQPSPVQTDEPLFDKHEKITPTFTNSAEEITPTFTNSAEEITPNDESPQKHKRKKRKNKNNRQDEMTASDQIAKNTSKKSDTNRSNNRKRQRDDKLNEESSMGVAWSRMEAFGMHVEVKRAKAAKKKAKLAKGK